MVDGFYDGVQACGALVGARVYGLPLCLLRLPKASGSLGYCPVGGPPCPRDAPPGWVGALRQLGGLDPHRGQGPLLRVSRGWCLWLPVHTGVVSPDYMKA